MGYITTFEQLTGKIQQFMSLPLTLTINHHNQSLYSKCIKYTIERKEENNLLNYTFQKMIFISPVMESISTIKQHQFVATPVATAVEAQKMMVKEIGTQFPKLFAHF